MANRWLNQFPLTFEKVVVHPCAKVSIGATGAPTLSASNSKGVLSVSRLATGRYKFIFGSSPNGATQLDTYVKVLGINAVFDTSGNSNAAPVSPIPYIYDNAISSSAYVTVQFVDYAGSAADPANGEIMYIDFVFGNSTAP